MNDTTILVELPADRTKLGRISLAGSTRTSWGPVPCYAKSDDQQAARRGNPKRDPLKPFGDTPLGDYSCTVAHPALTPHISHSYGPNGFVVLRAIGGQAEIAEKNGRFGLLIHGGDLNAKGALRPTFGCVRVRNDNLKAMLAVIAPAMATGVRCRIVELVS